MKKDYIIDFLGFLILKAMIMLFWFMPLSWVLFIGRRLGDVVYLLNHKRRMIAYSNLKSAFPEKDFRQLRRINRRHFENLGMNVMELIKIPSIEKKYFDRYIELRNVKRIRDVIDHNNGVILLTAHFGNWELAPLVAKINGLTVLVFAREQKYVRLNSFLNKYREASGCKVITKGFSVRDIIKTLNSKGIVGMLSDQDAGSTGVFVDFLNRPASIAKGVVVFAQKTKAKIMPNFIWRDKKFTRHIIQVHEPVELTDTGNEEKDLKVDLQRMADLLADYVRKFPDQWLWSHKRWKSTPHRNVLILSDGKAGHLNQSKAIRGMYEEALISKLMARGIGEKAVLRVDIVDIKFKNRLCRLFLDLASIVSGTRCQGCLRCLRFCLTKESFEAVKNKYADAVISCGASTVAVNIFLQRENNAKNIIIMKPGLGRMRKVDLVVLPAHDSRRWTKRVVVTEAAPNGINPEFVKLKAEKTGIKPGGIGIVIGGDTKGFVLNKDSVEKALNAGIRVAEERGVNIFVSTSRRTAREIEELVKSKMSGNAYCKLLIIANEKNMDEALPIIFGLSDIVIVSPESVSMISEAVSSGKYVVVFKAAEGNTKYGRLIENLSRAGYLRAVQADAVYNTVCEILDKRPENKRLNDREIIVERLKAII